LILENMGKLVPGIKVGHYTNLQAVTGLTVVLCPQGAVAGVEVRGSAPGTRETDLLAPGNLVERVNAVLLTGGSAFGLDAAGGVMRYLEEKGIGFEAGLARVPIVPAAVIFDLGIGDPKTRPGQEEGYKACLTAEEEFEEGSVGAGTGATVGKVLGMAQATKGGLGASRRQVGGLVVSALAVVNAMGDVVDAQTGKTLAGPRGEKGFLNTTKILEQIARKPPPFNTTLGVVVTNARLSREQAHKLAQRGQDGLTQTIRPAHTPWDGDAVFALSLGEEKGDMALLGALAAEVMAEAVRRAIKTARGLGGVPAAGEAAI